MFFLYKYFYITYLTFVLKKVQMGIFHMCIFPSYKIIYQV